jgi:DNA-binding CsgD family transcriptional regulator
MTPTRETRQDAELRSLREALSALGERLTMGLVVAEPNAAIVFATPRAHRLFGKKESTVLPQDLHPFVEAALTTGDGSPADGHGERIELAGSRNRVSVKSTRLAGSKRTVLLMLEEEAPRGAVTTRLVERYKLSPRSIQLVQLASRGLTNREIGLRMKLAEASVKTYMHTVFRELGVRNRAELAALAERLARET